MDRRRTRDSMLNKKLQQHRAAFREYLTVDAHGNELWRVTARVVSDVDYGKFVRELRAVVDPMIAACREQGVKGLDVVYTGMVPLVYKTQRELLKGLFESLLLAFALVAVVMVVILRSPSAGLLAMGPNLFPVVVIFGIMSWTGILVDIGSMMTASVALGIAVDDTIHFLTWFRFGLDKGLGRKAAVMLAYERCATAMTQTTLIGGLGLAVFAFSSFGPTQRFGMLMLTLLAAALVGDLIFLPAMLTSPMGRFFRGAARRSSPEPISSIDGRFLETVTKPR
jgi:predicted RND superfamily exporter protein